MMDLNANMDIEILRLALHAYDAQSIIKKIKRKYQQEITTTDIKKSLSSHNISIGINTEILDIKEVERPSRLEEKKAKEQELKKRRMLTKIKKVFGNTVSELKNLDKNFKVLPIRNYLDGYMVDSEYSLLYKKFLHLALPYIRKEGMYLSFFDWYNFFKESNNIVYYEEIQKYDTREHILLRKINSDLKWSVENIMLNTEKNKIQKIEKENIIKNKKREKLQRNKEIVDLYREGKNYAEINFFLENKYKKTLSIGWMEIVLKNSGVTLMDGGTHLATKIRQEKVDENKENLKKIKTERYKEEILNFFGNSIDEMLEFDNNFKIMSIASYLRSLNPESEFNFMYSNFMTAAYRIVKYKEEPYLKFTDWFEIMTKNEIFTKNLKTGFYEKNKNNRLYIKKINPEDDWRTENIRISRSRRS